MIGVVVDERMERLGHDRDTLGRRCGTPPRRQQTKLGSPQRLAQELAADLTRDDLGQQ
jgi:hypothetical protein